MARYGLYASINEDSLKSSASSLKAKASSCKGELESFKGTLTDDIWKATAKQTLLTGYDKLSSEVYSELDSKLDTIDSVCSLIKKYKTAEKQAKQCKYNLNSKDESIVKDAQTQLIELEREMENCESQISSQCSG